MNILSAEAKNRLKDIAVEFASAKPFRHVVIDNFLEPALAEAMLANFPSHPNPDQLVNEFGDHNPKSAISDVKGLGGIYEELDTAIQERDFIGDMELITGVQGLKYDPYYFGAGTHENFHGAGLDAHIDFNLHPVTKQHRRLNAIVYLNKEWNPKWKGQICLHTNPYDIYNDQVTEIIPLFNRCIIFETNEISWHSVKPVDLPINRRLSTSRKSFTIYMYTNERSKEETAPSHGTVYIQDALPNHLRPGYTLSEEDLNQLRDNFQRRNLYLKNLYKREYRFSQAIDELQAELTSVESRVSVPIVGPVKHISTRVSTFSDGWVGSELIFKMLILRPISNLKFVLYRPEFIDYPVKFDVNIGDLAFDFQISSVGLFEQTFRLEKEIEGEIEFRMLTSDAKVIGDGADSRKLSLVLDRIEFS